MVASSPAPIQYPRPRRDETVTDTYHSKHTIADPYRWLEDPTSEETQQWISEENQVFKQYIDSSFGNNNSTNHHHGDESNKFHPENMIIELTKMMDYEKMGCPFKRGDRVFYYKNNGLQNQYVMYVKPFDNGKGLLPKSSDHQEEDEVFLDPNKFSEDGTSALQSRAFSMDGEYFAYGISDKGSDWQSIHIMSVKDKKKYPEVLKYCKFTSIAFDERSEGFFYTRFPAPKTNTGSLGSETDVNENQCVYYHRLNTPQEEDVLIYKSDEHSNWMFGVTTTHDGKYLVITVSESTAVVNRLFIATLNTNANEPLFTLDQETGLIKVDKLIDNFDAEYGYLANDGSLFYFQTNLNAQRSRIITIDIESEKREPKELIAEKEDPLESSVVVAQDYLVLCYAHNVHNVIQVYNLRGEYLRDIELPAIGSISSISARREDSFMFYNFNSFTYPGTVFSYDFSSNSSTVFYETKTSDLIMRPDAFETKQIWYTSKDGTKIPMFVVHRKGIDITSGNNPTWLYGYGGFSISLQPYFSVLRVFFMQYFNGVYAVANLRGGAEFGEAWHEAGIKDKKQNGFDDMIAAAEYLVESKITRPEKIWINGGSNGGLLVAACTNQRPDLFGAAVAQVGVLDMLRYHKFTIGKHWVSDYGCADNEADFEYLIKYSPLHNIRQGKQYPSCLVVTSDHDDRVVPLHSFKYIAELQHQLGETNEKPLMIRIETKAGHGAGKPLSKTIEEFSEIFAFVAKELHCC